MAIYKDESDYLYFLESLCHLKERYGFKVHAICLMTNHFHILLETGNDELWKIMQKLLSVYAEDFNHRYKYTGHLFEGRYTACLIEDERYFLEVSRYIHLNPVKAGMVREPLIYDYSSYRYYMAETGEEEVKGQNGNSRVLCRIADLVDRERVLRSFHNEKEQYRMFVEGKISHSEQEMLIQKDMNEDDTWLPW